MDRLPSRPERIAERLLGARIDHVEVQEGRLVVVFGHRGTDDDSGYMFVPPSFVAFTDGGDPDAWKQDA